MIRDLWTQPFCIQASHLWNTISMEHSGLHLPGHVSETASEAVVPIKWNNGQSQADKYLPIRNSELRSSGPESMFHPCSHQGGKGNFLCRRRCELWCFMSSMAYSPNPHYTRKLKTQPTFPWSWKGFEDGLLNTWTQVESAVQKCDSSR